MKLDSASNKLYGDDALKAKVATAVQHAIETGVFATQQAVYNLDGGWYAFLEGNEVVILNYQTDEAKRLKTGPFNFFTGIMANAYDAAKKLYRQFMLAEVPGNEGWVGAVYPSVCKVGDVAYVKFVLLYRHVDYSVAQLEADRTSIVGNPDLEAPKKSELGYIFTNNARIDGPVSIGVVVYPTVTNSDELPGGRGGWMPVDQFIIDSHEPMVIAALAKGEKTGAF